MLKIKMSLSFFSFLSAEIIFISKYKNKKLSGYEMLLLSSINMIYHLPNHLPIHLLSQLVNSIICNVFVKFHQSVNDTCWC